MAPSVAFVLRSTATRNFSVKKGREGADANSKPSEQPQVFGFSPFCCAFAFSLDDTKQSRETFSDTTTTTTTTTNMAPNVKQLHLLASSLADLEVVQAKYLPLTHPASDQQVAQPTTQAPSVPSRTPAQIEASASYWDWQPEVPSVQEEAVEEPKKDLFSAASIEANLIKDSQRTASANIVVAEDTAENDYYWQERVEQADQTKPQHDDYWFSPANPEEAHIQAILNDEFARQSVSLETIEKHLLAARSALRATGQKPANDDYWCESAPVVERESLKQVYSQNYWTWESDVSGKSESNKAALIQAILAEEQCRQLVSLARLEHNLQTSVLPACGQTKASSDEVWSWSHDATPSDSYWDTSAPKAVGHQVGYWDM